MLSRLHLTVIAILVGITVLALVLLFQQGGLLQASLRGAMTNTESTVSEETVDETTAQTLTLEQYCAGVKESHVAHCGHMPPEKDYECRTTHAEHAYQECLTTTTPEDVASITEAAGDDPVGDTTSDSFKLPDSDLGY